MPAPPAKAKISAPFPNPSNAVAREGLGEQWETLFGIGGLLGSTGLPADARTALGAAASVNAALTGTPTAPNVAAGTRGTRIATMQSFADEFPKGTGWTKQSNGTMKQYGAATSSASGDVVVTFPVAFPTAVHSINLTVVTAGASGAYFGCVGTYHAGAFSFGVFDAAGNRVLASVFWSANGS